MSWIRARIASWQEKSALVRALWTTLGLLAGSALVVSVTAYAAVFPPASEETLATAAGASEVDVEGDPAAAAPKSGATKAQPKAGTRSTQPVKRTQARRGEST